MLKALFKLICEFFIVDCDGNNPLRWRLGMRLNHLNLAMQNYPTLYNFGIQFLRFVVCRSYWHHWTKWESVKYGDFGQSRTCKVCHLHHNRHKDVDTYNDTHRKGGWVKVDEMGVRIQ